MPDRDTFEDRRQHAAFDLKPLHCLLVSGPENVRYLSGFTGSNETAFGFAALSSDQAGGYNTSVGSQSLQTNVDDLGETAIGAQALFTLDGSATPGVAYYNTAIGYNALSNVATGGGNIALGASAAFNFRD